VASLSRWVRGATADLFSIDRRSLAALRVALGFVLLFDLGLRSRLLSVLYTNAGVNPMERSLLVVHTWGESATYEAGVFVVAAIAASLLFLGLFTRPATVACFILTNSLGHRNGSLCDGGDSLLGLMLLWSCFLPLGDVASLDAWRQRGRPRPVAGSRVLSVAGAALLVQPAIMYVSTALQKRGPEWRDGSAVWYAFQQDTWALPLATVLREYPTLCMVLTRSAHAIELIAPLLLFVPLGPFAPVAQRRLRYAGMASLFLLQLGLAFTIQLGLFPVHSTLSLLPFIPAGFWERVAPKLPAFLGLDTTERDEPRSRDSSSPKERRRWNDMLVSPLWAFVILFSIAHLAGRRIRIPSGPLAFGDALGLIEGWTMYAPSPRRVEASMTLAVVSGSGTRLSEEQLDPRWQETMAGLRSDYRAKYYLSGLYPDEPRHPDFVAWVCRDGAREVPPPKSVVMTLAVSKVGHRDDRYELVHTYPCP
jgi:hypothetical protein